MESRLVHVDDRLIAVSKASGVSLATRRGDPGAAVVRLLGSLPAAERRRCGEPDGLWLVHRLDVATTGLVLLARSAEVHREVVAGLSERRLEKSYLALVWGRPRPAAGSWVQALGPDRGDRRRMRTDPTGKPAETGFRVLGRAPHVALLELRPRTGRTHQLRVHCAAAGHPIVGDDLYGGPRHRGVRDAGSRRLLARCHLLLHAWRLRVPAADAAVPPLELEAPLPEAFAGVLAGLAIAAPGG